MTRRNEIIERKTNVLRILVSYNLLLTCMLYIFNLIKFIVLYGMIRANEISKKKKKTSVFGRSVLAKVFNINKTTYYFKKKGLVLENPEL